MNYTCEYCGKIFNQKSHYDSHKNKKIPCKKCDKNFITEWAYINNEYLHISTIDKKSKNKIRCKNGHELVFCSGNIKRPYQQIKYPSSQKLTNVYFYFSYVNLTNAESQNDNRRVMTVYICGSNDDITYDLLHSNIAQNINWTAINQNFYTVGFINALTNNNEYQYFRIIYNTVNGDNYYAINEIILKKLTLESIKPYFLVPININMIHQAFVF